MAAASRAIDSYRASGDDEVSQRADAVQAATLKPFMAIESYNATGGPPTFWSTELASRGIIAFDTDGFFADQQAQPGLRWAYSMDDGIRELKTLLDERRLKSLTLPRHSNQRFLRDVLNAASSPIGFELPSGI